MTFGYALVQPWLRLAITATAEEDTVDTSQVSTFFGADARATSSVFQRLPLANLFNDGRNDVAAPVAHLRHARQPPVSVVAASISRRRPSSRATYFGSRDPVPTHRFTGRFYYPLGGGTGAPGSGFILKLNTEFGLITSPEREGVPIFTRFFLGGILDVRGYQLRSIGARLPLNQSLDPNAPPIANGANIGGNLEAYENLEFEFPIIDKVGIRGVVVLRRRQRLEHREPVLQDDPRAAVRPRREPVLQRVEPRLPAHLGRLRHSLVLAARPAPVRVGFPASAAPLRAALGVRVHDRKLLLIRARAGRVAA